MESRAQSIQKVRGSTASCSRPPLAVLIAALLLGISGCGSRDAGKQRLLLYCGAGLKEPVAELAAEFQQDRGVTVECDYQGSETLLSRIKLLRRGDLYLYQREYLPVGSSTILRLHPNLFELQKRYTYPRPLKF